MATRRRLPRGLTAIAACILAAGPVGCYSAPPMDNPVLVRHNAENFENPILVSPGRPTEASYKEVFEKCVDILNDYFDLNSPTAQDGRIVSKPRIAPGYEQFWKPGNPDTRRRLFATFQSVRQTATVEIRVGERGGYLVYVVVETELEDVSRPSQAVAGGAIFQESPTVNRQVEVISADAANDQLWFKVGRDYAFEQQILRRIRQCK